MRNCNRAPRAEKLLARPSAVLFMSRRASFDMQSLNFGAAEAATVVGADCLI
jgi:hypothetical protein